MNQCSKLSCYIIIKNFKCKIALANKAAVLQLMTLKQAWETFFALMGQIRK